MFSEPSENVSVSQNRWCFCFRKRYENTFPSLSRTLFTFFLFRVLKVTSSPARNSVTRQFLVMFVKMKHFRPSVTFCSHSVLLGPCVQALTDTPGKDRKGRKGSKVKLEYKVNGQGTTMEFVRSGGNEKPSLERRTILSRDGEQTTVIAFIFVTRTSQDTVNKMRCWKKVPRAGAWPRELHCSFSFFLSPLNRPSSCVAISFYFYMRLFLRNSAEPIGNSLQSI